MNHDRKKPGLDRASAALQNILSGLKVDIKGVACLHGLKGTRLEESALKLLPSARSVVVLGMELYPEFLDLTSPERKMGTVILNQLFFRHVEYQRGLFYNDDFRKTFLNNLRRYWDLPDDTGNAKNDKEEQYNKLAEHVHRNLNIPEIYRIMGIDSQ